MAEILITKVAHEPHFQLQTACEHFEKFEIALALFQLANPPISKKCLPQYPRSRLIISSFWDSATPEDLWYGSLKIARAIDRLYQCEQYVRDDYLSYHKDDYYYNG